MAEAPLPGTVPVSGGTVLPTVTGDARATLDDVVGAVPDEPTGATSPAGTGCPVVTAASVVGTATVVGNVTVVGTGTVLVTGTVLDATVAVVATGTVVGVTKVVVGTGTVVTGSTGSVVTGPRGWPGSNGGTLTVTPTVTGTVTGIVGTVTTGSPAGLRLPSGTASCAFSCAVVANAAELGAVQPWPGPTGPSIPW